MATVERDGQVIGFTDSGGDGPVVVLLHSFAMDGRMFAPQQESLAGFRVVTVDGRGHGGSPTDRPYDFWDSADDVLAVLDALGVARAAVCGTSQGGFTALRVALRAPERVGALALFGTSAAAEAPEVAEAYRALAAAWRDAGPSDELVATVAALCFGTAPTGPWPDRWRAGDGAAFARNVDVLVSRDDLVDRLPEVACPALVVHGSDDAAYPVDRAEQTARGLPAAEPLVVVPGGAHFLSLTDATAVDAVLLPFLQRHAPAPA